MMNECCTAQNDKQSAPLTVSDHQEHVNDEWQFFMKKQKEENRFIFYAFILHLLFYCTHVVTERHSDCVEKTYKYFLHEFLLWTYLTTGTQNDQQRSESAFSRSIKAVF